MVLEPLTFGHGGIAAILLPTLARLSDRGLARSGGLHAEERAKSLERLAAARRTRFGRGMPDECLELVAALWTAVLVERHAGLAFHRRRCAERRLGSSPAHRRISSGDETAN